MDRIDNLVSKITCGEALTLEELLDLGLAATKWRGMAASFAEDLLKACPEKGQKIADVLEGKLRVDVTSENYSRVIRKARQG